MAVKFEITFVAEVPLPLTGFGKVSFGGRHFTGKAPGKMQRLHPGKTGWIVLMGNILRM